MVIPSPSDNIANMALSNGLSPSLTSNSPAVNGELVDNNANYNLSEQSNNFTSSESSPDAEMEDESYHSGSPDAEGVGSYSATDSSEKGSSPSSIGNSSSSEIKSGIKRKSSPPSESDFIRQNPDLYGLRRSGRARTTRQVVQSTSSESESVARVSRTKRRRPVASQRSSKRPSPPPSQSSYSAESDDDEYVGPSRTSKAKRRRMLQPASNNEPSHAEIRFSTRNASRRVSNYNEDDDDDMFLDEPDEVMDNYQAYLVEDDRPAVDVVLNHRPKEGVSPGDNDVDEHSFEFYIKWQGKSHYHATWETYKSLIDNCRGTRRVDNYIRKVLSEELRMNHDGDALPEEREKWNLDRERDVDAIEDYKHVERVIAMRDGDEGTEYLVKWKRLFYDSCTWESESLVSQIAQREVDRFLDRSSHPPLSDKTEMNPATRKPFEPIKGTPSFLQNGELKDFQVKGVNFMAFNWVKNRNVVLADEMGLGKTVQTVAFIAWMRHVRRQQGPFIVVVPLSTMPSWAETFDNWSPDLNYVVYNGNEAARTMLKDYELMIDGNPRRAKFNVLLTTYEYVLQDSAFLSQFKWQFMAVDEAHRLKNRDSQLYLKLLEFRSPARLLITGTPIQNNLAELSALMDFLNPGVIDVDVDMDLNAEAASQKLAALTNAIQPYMLRRTKSKVESDLPPKTEKIIRVELSDVQLEYYKNILTKNYAALNDGAQGQKQSLLNIMMELKKASNHPFMFPNAEAKILEGSTRREDVLRALITSSGKMMLLDQLLAKLKRDGHRVLIFSQMVKMLDLLGEYMESRGYSYQRLDGTIPAASRRLAIEHFNAPDSSDFCFLLSTRAGGLGINLMTADTVILFDSDWNPQADLQAMARAHRIGQTRPVSVYRLVSKDTVEEEVIERARNKLLLEFITIQRGVTDKEASEIQNKMARSGISVSEPNSTEDISRILKRRGQKMFEQTGNQQKLEQLDIDSVLANAELHQTEQAEGIQADGGEEFLKAFDFVDIKVDDLTWDDIIPKDQLDEIKAEEKRKADERYLAEQIEMSRPRKRNAPAEGQDSREERKAKRRARAQVTVDEGDSSDESHQLDPKRPLNHKEIRHLYRALVRYGDINERTEEFLREARLIDRDRETILAVLREMSDMAAKLIREDDAKMEALEKAGKIVTKKERKAVLFDFKGANRLNAHHIVDRPRDLRILRQVTSSVADVKSFRIPEATKAADYSCSWGAREDGMLCVGVARHGWGAWTQIRDDPELGLGDKLFLEEHRVEKKNERANADDKTTKTPGAVHLVRRVEYLLSVLRDKLTNGTSVSARRAVENHHRNHRSTARTNASVSVSASPAPSIVRKGHREADRPRHRSHTHGARDSVERNHTPGRDSRPKSGQENDRPRRKLSDASSEDIRRRKPSERKSSDNGNSDEMLRLLFKPILSSLERVSGLTRDSMTSKARRASELRNLLGYIGGFIRKTLKGENYMPSLEIRLWEYVAINYWPNKEAGGRQLQTMYQKIVAANNATANKDGSASTPYSARD
ncbi:chromodomain helicase hrp3 [Aspergillus udagawae]|nr:chromodomain helicase hrp3 [Aspergillus udagawae]